MTIKARNPKKNRPFPMGLAEYQALAARMEERHGADKRWEDLPVIPLPGRPTRHTSRTPLEPHSFKVPAAAWKKLAQAAKRHHVTASSVLAGLLVKAVESEPGIDQEIETLIGRNIVHPR